MVLASPLHRARRNGSHRSRTDGMAKMAGFGTPLIVGVLSLATTPLPDTVVEALRRYAKAVDGATITWSRRIRILDASELISGDDGSDLRMDPDTVQASVCRLTTCNGAYRVHETW